MTPSVQLASEGEAEVVGVDRGRRPGAHALQPPQRRAVGLRDEGAQANAVAGPLGEGAEGGPAVAAERDEHASLGRHADRGLDVVQRREPGADDGVVVPALDAESPLADRRERHLGRKDLRRPLRQSQANEPGAREDDRLRLIFTCCHPALPPEGQVALTLREICGLTTEEIARAFLVTPATLAQRIVRAKAKIRETPIPYEVPTPQELPERLDMLYS